jgi:hypothetical protein
MEKWVSGGAAVASTAAAFSGRFNLVLVKK